MSIDKCKPSKLIIQGGQGVIPRNPFKTKNPPILSNVDSGIPFV